MVIKRLPEVIVASTRKVIPDFESLSSMIPEMGAMMEKAGCICAMPEYCFNIYHDGEYKEEDIDIEICEAVTEMKEDFGDLKFKMIDEIPTAICTMHKGLQSRMHLLQRLNLLRIMDTRSSIMYAKIISMGCGIRTVKKSG